MGSSPREYEHFLHSSKNAVMWWLRHQLMMVVGVIWTSYPINVFVFTFALRYCDSEITRRWSYCWTTRPCRNNKFANFSFAGEITIIRWSAIVQTQVTGLPQCASHTNASASSLFHLSVPEPLSCTVISLKSILFLVYRALNNSGFLFRHYS